MLLTLALAAAQSSSPAPADVVAIARWTYCLTRAAEARTVAGASPDAVADAALGACRSDEDAVVAAQARNGDAASAEQGRGNSQRRARDYIANRTRARLAAIAGGPVSAARNAHSACVGERVVLEAVSTERAADALVDEALAGCAPLEERLRAALTADGGRAFAERTMDGIRSAARGSGLVLVGEVRRPRDSR